MSEALRRHPVDVFVERAKLYASAILVISAALTAGGALMVRAVTQDVKTEVRAVRSEVTQAIAVQNQRAVTDSVRFERVMQVVELAVVAIVESDGSPEQRGAIAELRRRRRVTSQ